MSSKNEGSILAGILSVIAVIIAVWVLWLTKEPLCINSVVSWGWAVITALILSFIWSLAGEKSPIFKAVMGITIVLFVMFIIGIWGSSSFFNSRSFRNSVASMVEVIECDEEGSSFPNLLGSNNDTSNLPLLGVPEAVRNSETLMGKQPALGSQFELLEKEFTSQNIGNSLMYVAPLEPKKWYKWDGSNHGYFVIDRNNSKTEFVESGLFSTEKSPFSSNAKRVIYSYMKKNGIKGRITELSPEITDDGQFNYVASVYQTSGIEGFKRVTGVVELNASSEDLECQYYSLDEVPDYIDRVFPEEIFDDYVKYYGAYEGGWWNSWTKQKGVLLPTEGSDIVYIDGICWYYTGFTSAGKDESSNGIIMMNCRTGEIKYYITYGISEAKAMSVAEGRVQEKGYKASYPLPLMVGGQETWFMLMRDQSENLCGYAFVSYKDYTKSAVSDTLASAQTMYIKSVSSSNSADLLDNLDLSTGKAKITQIGCETKDGSTVWYIMMEGNDHIFSVTSAVEPLIVFAAPGDMAEVSYVEAESQVVSAVSMKVTLNTNQ